MRRNLIVQKYIAILSLVLISTVVLGLGRVWVATANGGPHGDYLALTDDCAGCHRVHTAPGARLLFAQTNALCFTCHDGSGASLPPIVSTHANTDSAGRVEGLFALECIQCHNPHGNNNNLYCIRDDVYVQTATVTSGPVIFTATTGANSYDDGVSIASSRICVSCHSNGANSGFPMTNHVGGANHLGGYDFTGLDCLVCHPHSPDADIFTNDGFMATGGSCTACHSVPIGTRRQIVAAGGDFALASHHVNGAVQDSDCVACHDVTNHMDGDVELYNAEDPATIITLLADPGADPVEAAKLEPFCLDCHDVGGADGAGGPAEPFSDGLMPPEIEAAWTLASHNGGAGTCYDCHDNGHGSNKAQLLAPWNATPDGDLNDPLQQEERFCYICHDADGPASTNIQAQFAMTMTSRHPVANTETTSTIECVSCHNPHRNTPANVVSDPDDNDALANNDNAFCLACHDGAPPAGIVFGAGTSTGFDSGWNKTAFITDTASAHNIGDIVGPAFNGPVTCQDCHEHHGSNASGYADLLKGQYTRLEGAGLYPDEFALCWNCHNSDVVFAPADGAVLVGNNNFGGEHATHTDDGPCIYCHDVHAPEEPGEAGLTNYSYGAAGGILDYEYRNGPTTYVTTPTTVYDRIGNGMPGDPQCGMTCHGTQHGNRNFTPTTVDTTP
jgi:predicted CXXCH cytochrome family protein